ncbi:MAG TPA: glycoside hydrolase [Bacillus bacterium]|nr:glycoside hydrolase [Bacillus sp. (in: firmicutes)]
MNRNKKKSILFLLIAFLLLAPMHTNYANAEKINYSYIYSVSKNDYIKHVDQTNNSVDVISPNYYDLAKDGSLVITANFDSNFIKEMHKRSVKVVPFLSNHWDKSSGINALKNTETLATKLANEIDKYNLDGINIDMEGLSHTEKDSFSQFIKVLSEKLPAEKELSVAVAANPKGLTTGWHGSYDYKKLAEYADYLIIMAYDESYGGSDPGPVASLDFVEKSIQYALNQGIAGDKIVLGIPFYGRIWRVEDLQTRKGIVGDGIWMDKTASLLENYGGVAEYIQGKGSYVGRVTLTENDSPFQLFSWREPLKPGNYEIWFDNEQTIQKKLELVNKYNLKGTANWSLGQESVSLWAHYKTWLHSTVAASGDAKDESGSKNLNQTPNYQEKTVTNTRKNAVSQIEVIINGEILALQDEGPIIYSNRTLVPLRGIFEALGATVDWNSTSKEITAIKADKAIWLKANSTMANVDGRDVTIDVPAQIRNGRTMVPLRFISESFDATVDWNSNTKTVTINM